MTLVVSGFPGVGKSYAAWALGGDMFISDSDSSAFSWLLPKVRHPDFPYNYVKYVQSLLGRMDVVLVSSHKEVRDLLVDQGIRFALVYPEHDSQATYMERYRDRGSDDAFVELLRQNWGLWLDELEQQEGCRHVRLGPGEYLSDVLPSLLKGGDA